MVSKSAQYCFTDKKNPVGLMLLSEVALGEVHELKKAMVSWLSVICMQLCIVINTDWWIRGSKTCAVLCWHWILGDCVHSHLYACVFCNYFGVHFSPLQLTRALVNFSTWINLLEASTLLKALAKRYLWSRNMLSGGMKLSYLVESQCHQMWRHQSWCIMNISSIIQLK